MSTFLKNSFRNTVRVSNSLDPDQARLFVGHGLGPYCLYGYQQMALIMLSADIHCSLDLWEGLGKLI